LRLKPNINIIFVPLLLITAAILGGASRPGQDTHLLLQLTACLISVGLLFVTKKDVASATVKITLFLTISMIVWTGIQLLPMPSFIWTNIGDRVIIQENFEAIGYSQKVRLPISFSPRQTFESLLGFLPPLAVFLLILAVGWRQGAKPLVWFIPIIGAVSLILGLVQVFMGADSILYWHDITHHGFPVGFFANVNHNATLALMSLPLLGVLGSEQRSKGAYSDNNIAIYILIATLFLVNLLGVLIMGAVAGYLLLLPALIFLTALWFGGQRVKVNKYYALAAMIVISLFAYIIFTSPFLKGLGVTSFDNHNLSRRGIWRQSILILKDNFIFGTGLGGFDEVYRLYEDTSAVTNKYVNHAHNDVLQLFVEWGLPARCVFIITRLYTFYEEEYWLLDIT